MRSVKRVLLGVFVLLLALAILLFVLENQQSVSLLFLGWAGPQIPLSLVVVLNASGGDGDRAFIGVVPGPSFQGGAKASAVLGRHLGSCGFDCRLSISVSKTVIKL